ncbi:MAG TPA: AAA family ATPase [Candidatus Dormibacteraeota bacterium]|nr:AAA family ATPase [Candidatus Dormibacteraeota bacterium]
MTIEIPELCLVVLVGPAGAGKSTFAAARFGPTEVLSSDAFRALVADREDDLSATPAAFEALHHVAALRLRRRRLTVIDAVSARPRDRRPLLQLAAAADCAAVAIVLDPAHDLCVRRDRERPGRTVGERVIAAQRQVMHASLGGLCAEGFGQVHHLRTDADIGAATIRRTPLAVNRRGERGPFDVIGDVRGRLEALTALLDRLGYRRGSAGAAAHPEGRRAVFAGDLVGPGTGPSPSDAAVVRQVAAMVAARSALAVKGDRDDAAAAGLPEPERAFLRTLPSHLVLARGRLVVAHAGIGADLQGRDSPRVTRVCLHGEPGWAARYRGAALVAHAHEPPATSDRRQGRTVSLHATDALTALRYPELELVL